MKDMGRHFAPGTEIGAVLSREDRRDALVGPFRSLDDLPKGANWYGLGAARGDLLNCGGFVD